MNKFDMMNVVQVSTLAAQDKSLLTELILRSDESGESFPSVQRLCMARGMKHEKNFKGADVYLEGLVTKVKRGRKNYYRLNETAILALESAQVVIKHTPSRADNTPATEDNTPALADNTPDDEGANSSMNTSRDSSEDSSRVRFAPSSLSNVREGNNGREAQEDVVTGSEHAASVAAGVSEPFEW